MWCCFHCFTVPGTVYMVIFAQRRRAPRVGVGTRFRRRFHFAFPFRKLRVSLTYFWYLVIGIILIFGIRYVVARTIFASQFTIQKIVYDSGSVGLYDNPYLYKDIRQALLWENFYLYKRFSKGELLDRLQASFPIVKDLQLFYLDKNTVAASVRFYDPDIVFYQGDSKYAVFKDSSYLLLPQNTLGQDVPRVALPSYLTGLQNLDGIFYPIASQDLVQQIKLIQSYFTRPKNIVYLPGAERTLVVTADNKNIYINNLQDIKQQLQKIDRLKQYYPDLAQLKEIDLWSLDASRIIVRK